MRKCFNDSALLILIPKSTKCSANDLLHVSFDSPATAGSRCAVDNSIRTEGKLLDAVMIQKDIELGRGWLSKPLCWSYKSHVS